MVALRYRVEERCPSPLVPVRAANAERVGSELVLRKATPVVVEHAIPTLSVAAGPELWIATSVVVEAFDPTLVVAHRHCLLPWGEAMPAARNPALTSLPTIITKAEPALLLALLLPPHPKLALREREADLGARLDGAGHKLVRVLAIVLEATDCRTKALEVGEQGPASISDHRVLLLARRPVLTHSSAKHGGEDGEHDDSSRHRHPQHRGPRSAQRGARPLPRL
mmetsp:Transcript_6988/g.15659  ORF Transcript_6988/g.15659 Transcript_6988/m.15659 type:complete len:224 (+) Transcript_6988:13-684(+)